MIKAPGMEVKLHKKQTDKKLEMTVTRIGTKRKTKRYNYRRGFYFSKRYKAPLPTFKSITECWPNYSVDPNAELTAHNQKRWVAVMPPGPHNLKLRFKKYERLPQHPIARYLRKTGAKHYDLEDPKQNMFVLRQI
jgi:hypothetical protein